MTKFADLHIHTNYSDSTLSPHEVVMEALKADLSCISITDHDTIDGFQPTLIEGQKNNLEVIPGIELSSELDGKDIHMLGYLFDVSNSQLNNTLKKIQDIRQSRIVEMIEKLKGLGVDNISPEEVFALTKSKSVGRPHLAAVLLKKGWVSSVYEAFQRFLGEGCPAYVEKFKQTPHEAIKLIQQAGGVAVLAHPMITNRNEIIPSLVQAGLKGLEVYYPNYSANTIQFYEGIAQKHGLIKTGGSDGHGAAKDNTYIGKIKIPYSIIEALKLEAGKANAI